MPTKSTFPLNEHLTKVRYLFLHFAIVLTINLKENENDNKTFKKVLHIQCPLGILAKYRNCSTSKMVRK